MDPEPVEQAAQPDPSNNNKSDGTEKQGETVHSNRWVKGQSGNPKGRPKGISITQELRKALEEIEPNTKETWLALTIKRILVKGVVDGDPIILKAIWEFIDGKPTQKIDATVKTELDEGLEYIRGIIVEERKEAHELPTPVSPVQDQ